MKLDSLESVVPGFGIFVESQTWTGIPGGAKLFRPKDHTTSTFAFPNTKDSRPGRPCGGTKLIKSTFDKLTHASPLAFDQRQPGGKSTLDLRRLGCFVLAAVGLKERPRDVREYPHPRGRPERFFICPWQIKSAIFWMWPCVGPLPLVTDKTVSWASRF